MLALTREAIVGHLVKLPSLVDGYVGGDQGFSDAVISWLGSVQSTLAQLRSPMVSMVSTGICTIKAVEDGYRNPNSAATTRAKARRVTAAAVLDEVDDALRHKVDEIDARLAAGSERLAQILAMCNGQVDLKRPEGEVGREWYDRLWVQIGTIPAVHDAHVFIGASFGASDRAYLLEELLDRLQP